MEESENEGKQNLPAYYYLQPSKNCDDETEEEELYDSNGTHITSDYLNDQVAKSMSDKYTILQSKTALDGQQYKCNECDKILPNSGHLIAHIVVHTGENPYVCSLCQRSFANSTRLKLHLKVHCIKKLHPGLTVTRITKSNAPSGADIPGTSIDEAAGEQQETPSAVTATFRCIECEQTLPKDILYRHMKQHLLEKNIFEEKSFKCGQCGEEFRKSLTFQQHQELCQAAIKVSSEVDLVLINKQEPCTSLKKQIECNPILSGLLLKEQHEPATASVTTIELDSQEEPEVQDLPEEETTDKRQEEETEELISLKMESDLQEEEPAEESAAVIKNANNGGVGFVISSVATVDQQFLENLAQMELQARSPMLEEISHPTKADRTVATDISPTTLPGYNAVTSTTCGLCGKSFSEKFGLRQHMRIMHAETKPYKCPECRKCFAKEHSMLIHLRVHVSNRPFMCIVCYKTFTRATALNGHLSSHSHDQLKCFACEQILSNVQKYAHHIEVNHPNFPEVLYRIRAEKPEHERTKMLRQLLLQHLAETTANAETSSPTVVN
uniref:C2H2-type domain-containing protein n=1 Tax=Anopheles farauti TaxID=69004 RepID=A0A182QW90_9DIPT